MIRNACFMLVMLVLMAAHGLSQNNNAVDAESLRMHVGLLAADSLSGRYPGTGGDQKAEKYIADCFSDEGLQMLCNNGRQEFRVVTEVHPGAENSLQLADYSAVLYKDFSPLSFTGNGKLKSPVVFAGFGFDLNLDSLRWNDYAGIDVNGKWVMIFRGDPEPDKPNSLFADYEKERLKVLTAKDKGAAGVLLISPVDIEARDIPMNPQYDRTTANAGILVVSITRSLADRMLAAMNDSVAGLVKRITETHRPSPMYMPVILEGAADIELDESATANIVAMIPGSDSVLCNEYIVIGAHHDHLGMGGRGSGSRWPDTMAVHNGADDNASGVAGLIELARKLSENRQQLKRSVIMVAFAGEEMGLLGSKEFVKNPPVQLSRIKAMINLDMIGRLDTVTKAVSVGGTGTAAETDTILSLLSRNSGLKISRSPDGYGPSDHASFYSENIPVFYFTSGAHEDYHTPADDADKLNYPGMASILDYVYSLAVDLSSRDQALSFRETGPRQGDMTGRKLKVTLGIVPDVVSSANDGLGVDGVRKGGPAEKAGIRKGDRIVSLNGQPVTNIYDYMARLGLLKPGQVTSAEIVRDGKKLVFIVQL